MQSIYVAGAGPGSGKSVVVLGLMELLSTLTGRVGFFRPIIAGAPDEDSLSQLIRERYRPPSPPSMSYGCTARDAGGMVGAGRYSDLLKLILDKYKQLHAACDIVLCAGTDYDGLAAELEFDFNADLANNLGCAIVVVSKGFQLAPEETLHAVNIAHESMRERGADLLATVINGVPSKHVDSVKRRARAVLPDTDLLFVLPDNQAVGCPTIGEIGEALGAHWLFGADEAATQVVTNYKVAAMEAPEFLRLVEDGCLIVTSGDRSDIILAALGAEASTAYPRVAGLVLTNGLAPPDLMQRLMAGLRRSQIAILGVPGDTFSTALALSKVEAKILADDARKIAAALGLFELNVDLDALKSRIAMRRSERVTPLMFEYELIRRAKTRRMHILLPEGGDQRILRAAEIIRLRDVADLTLLGNRDHLSRFIGDLGLQLEDIAIIDPAQSPKRAEYAETYHRLRRHKGVSEQMAMDALGDVSYFGTLMVHAGDADGMVSGATHTTQHTIRPAFEIIRTKPGVRLVSSVFFMCLADRVLVYGDCAVNPNPNAEALADIAVTSAATATDFGIEPRVAMLSYSTGSSGKGADVERVREAVALVRRRCPDLLLEGPIQYDAAVDLGVARSKLPDSPVAGRATVLIFPDLNTGNNTYKAVQRSADAIAIGPILQGLNKPVNDLSRGCTVTDVVNTIAITAVQAQGVLRRIA